MPFSANCSHGLVSMLERSNDRTPGVHRATGPPSLIQLLYTESTGIVRDRFEGGIQIRTAGVRKYRWLEIVRHSLVNMFERCNARTPGVQGATRLRSLVKLLYTKPTKPVRDLLEEAVQIRTTGVHKCRSLQIVCHGLVNMVEWSNACKPGVQGATGPPSLVQFAYTQPDSAIRSPTFGSCTEPHSKCTKYRSLQIVRHGMMYCREQPGSCTHGVQRATGHPSLVQFVYTQPNAAVRRPTSESCTDPYRRCTKISFTPYCLPRPGEHI